MSLEGLWIAFRLGCKAAGIEAKPRLFLVTEVPHAGEDHGEAGLIGCLDDLFIAE